MLAICDAGCKEEFTFNEFQLVRMTEGIEKTYFTCPHCQREYVAFYTDSGIRALQKKIRYRASKGRNVEKLQEENKVKMIAIRKRMEGTE